MDVCVWAYVCVVGVGGSVYQIHIQFIWLDLKFKIWN